VETGGGADEWDPGWENAPPWYPAAPDVDGGDEPDLQLLQCLDDVLRGIRPRQRDILRRRLGLAGVPESQQEIGEAIGVTRQRISQLEKKALARLGPGERNRRRRKPAELTFVEHLTCELRSRHRPQRGRYLRATFPETNDRVLAEVLGRLGPVGPCEVASWLRAFDVARREEDEQARRRERLERRWTRFVEGVTTPGGEVTSWPGFRPCRAVAEEGGTRWSAKLGRHVQYDSGLEETLILLFDESPHVAEYCEQPLRIRYQWFDGPHDYVPDFALRLQDGRTVLVEAKPRTMWVDAVNLAKWNAATRLCHGRGWAFVVSDGRGHPGDLIRLAEPADRSLLDALTAAGPASYPRLAGPWFGTGRTWAQLVSACLAYGYTLDRREGFAVTRARHSPWLDALRAGARAGGEANSPPAC